MANIASSIYNTGRPPIDLEKYRGPTGPTGPAGNTGPTGPVGGTGNTGIGISGLLFYNSDGITVYLQDGQQILLSGLSGNTLTNFNNISSFYKLRGSTGIIFRESASIIHSSSSGKTAVFMPIIFDIGPGQGFTGSYVGNDFVLRGVTTPGIKNVLLRDAASSSTVIVASPMSSFYYEQNTVGITTIDVAGAVIHNFILNSGTNVSTNSSSNANYYPFVSQPSSKLQDFITGSTTGIAFTQIDSDINSVTKFGTRKFINADRTNILGLTGTKKITTTYSVGNLGFTANHAALGSCCFCNSSGIKQCFDYYTPEQCVKLNGTFSLLSCNSRKNDSDCRYLSKCVVNGACINTDYDTCFKLGGAYTEGQVC